MKSFVSEQDIIQLKKLGINYHEDIIICINEIKSYFYKMLPIKYHKDINKIKLNDIDEFNKLLCSYTEIERERILVNIEDYISQDHVSLLSNKTIEILEYFYDIN